MSNIWRAWRDWRRGYTEADLASLNVKLAKHTLTAKPGELLPLNKGEFRALRKTGRNHLT